MKCGTSKKTSQSPTRPSSRIFCAAGRPKQTVTIMSKITAELANAAYRSDFQAFARKSFEVLNPTTLWKDNWHLRAISYQLERVRLGLCRRLIITLPPRFLKSHLGSIAWPAYMLG